MSDASKNIFRVYHIRIIAQKKKKGFVVTLHQFWVKKLFPWKFNLEYGGTFTKLFMHVSSRNMFPAIRNLQIQNIFRVYHIRIIAQKKKNGSHNMKQTDFSIIIVRNVCVLTAHTEYIFTCIRHFFHQLNSAHEP
jgi:hypothetical protein